MRVLLVLLALFASGVAQQSPPTPIIDVHLHAFKVADFGPNIGSTCGDNVHKEWPGWDTAKPFLAEPAAQCAGARIPPAKTDADLLAKSLAEMTRHDIRFAVTSGGLDD